jgi:hypothetical protein
VTLSGPQLAATKARIRAGDPAIRAPFHTLVKQANADLSAGPWSVMDKTEVPPGGSKHDYLSEAPYWWPTEPMTPQNPYGCPYVDRDGQTYPGAEAITDHNERGAAFSAIYTLTLAWYYTGDPAYAHRAELDLRTWFIDPATSMNPNLNYAQGIPCMVNGRGTGIIDFSEALPDVVDAAAILDSGAPAWTSKDHDAISSWFSQFLVWLQTSPNAIDEAASQNNHGSFFDEQEAALALYTGQRKLTRQIVIAAETKRIDVQIQPDGSEPLELARTLSWHYSTFNLMALTRLAQIGQHVGVNLWRYTTPAGGSMTKAVNFLIPAATGQAPWTYPQTGFEPYAPLDVIHAAAAAGDKEAAAALHLIPAPPGGDLWPVEPAAEQLDSVVG